MFYYSNLSFQKADHRSFSFVMKGKINDPPYAIYPKMYSSYQYELDGVDYSVYIALN